MISRGYPNDFDIVSMAVAAAYKAIWIPPRPLPDDMDLMETMGVPELAVIAPEAAERRGHGNGPGELPVAAWAPTIASLRIAGAYDQIANAFNWADAALIRFPTERLAAFDVHMIRRGLYSPASKWRGHFSATSASVAWLREFHFHCRAERWSADELGSLAAQRREARDATVIAYADSIARELARVEALAAKWLEQMPEAFDVLMASLAVEAEIAESSPPSEKFTRVFPNAVQDDEFRIEWTRFARMRELQERDRPPASDQSSGTHGTPDDDEQHASQAQDQDAGPGPPMPTLKLTKTQDRLIRAVWDHAVWQRKPLPAARADEVAIQVWGDEEKISTALRPQLSKINDHCLEQKPPVPLRLLSRGDWITIDYQTEL